MNYSNPQRCAVIKDWPSGMEQVTAIFSVETSKKGERVSRITQSVSGRESKPKLTTYAKKAMIVTGDDERIYIAQLIFDNCVRIAQSNMKFDQETIWAKDSRFAAILALFADAPQTV